MSDRFIPIRQYVPPSQTLTPKTYSLGENKNPGDLSFQATLNRQQMTQAQLKSMQSPTGRSQSVTRAGVKSMPAMPSAPNLQSLAQSSDMPPEVREMMKNAPAQVPQGEDLYKTMVRNAQQYQEMKSQGASKQPASNNSLLNASQKANPEQKMQHTPSFSGFDVNEVQPQPINADLMGGQSQNANGAPDSFHSALSGSPIEMEPVEKSGSLKPAIHETQNKVSSLNPKAISNRGLLSNKAESNNNSEEQNSSSVEKGPTESFFSFFKNVASAMTLGFYQPNGQEAPTGAMRVVDPFKKLFWNAPKSILYDTPSSLARSIGESKGEKSKSYESSSTKRVAAAEVAESQSYTRSSHSSSKPWLNRHG